jgi:LacI family transcriptional regulator
MSIPEKQEQPWRIATVWVGGEYQSPETFLALCRWADMTEGVTLRHFSADAPEFDRDVIQPLTSWQPQGLILRMFNSGKLRRLRRVFPDLPIVSTLYAPPALVDACVVTDITEVVRLACNHLRKHGVKSLALYFRGRSSALPSRLAAFRAVAPGGHELVHELPETAAPDRRGPDGLSDWDRTVGDWLHTLPRPAGVLATELGAAAYLVKQCRRVGLKVPLDVQVIGPGDTADALACEPHLTTLSLPWAAIGEAAMDTLLRRLRREAPPPPPVVLVGGGSLVPRGSTGMAGIGQPAVTSMLQMMDEHKNRRVSATRMAQLSGVSRATVYKQFKTATGQTPARHLRQMRLEEARRMLRESPATITAIAKACGFSSIFTFTRCFTRETGQSPTEYRGRG